MFSMPSFIYGKVGHASGLFSPDCIETVLIFFIFLKRTSCFFLVTFQSGQAVSPYSFSNAFTAFIQVSSLKEFSRTIAPVICPVFNLDRRHQTGSFILSVVCVTNTVCIILRMSFSLNFNYESKDIHVIGTSCHLDDIQLVQHNKQDDKVHSFLC